MTVDWLYRVRQNTSALADAIEYYEKEINDAKKETSLKGSVEKHSRDIPGIIENRFSQLQEMEAILEYLNIELSKMRSEKFKKYLEAYNRALSSRDAEKYIEFEQDIVDMKHLVNEFALCRNRMMAIIKGIDAKQYQIGNIIKLRAAGLEDLGL